MIVNIGYFSMLAAIALVFYTIAACLTGIKRNSGNLITSARYSLVTTFVLITAAYLSLCFAFATDNFAVKFVGDNSSTDLPLFYKFTAVWGGMQGSLLLWEFILAFFTAVVVLRYKETNRDILPYTMIVLSLISFFLLFLLIGWSNPFALQFPVPMEGRGMNPLLQNPGMVYHPPSLYLGYVGFSVPFAFAIGSMLRGKLDNDWILTTRRWTLFSWFFLTAGMILGAQWAYVELGWGGYWAWDPVENASLMPWLTGTAFLHSVIVQEKRNTLKIWNMILIIGTFTLSILGTFITRSGILGSVHSFSKSNIGPAFLFFIFVTLLFSMILLFSRQSLLTSKPQKAGIFSKENSFLMNNIIFVVMSFTVLYGTLFPLLAEALANKKLSIQAPFFNTIMTPLAILMILLMGFTHIMGWKKTSYEMMIKNTLFPMIVTIALMTISIFMIETSWQFLFISGTTIFAGCIVIAEFFRSIKINRSAKDEATSGLRKLVGYLLRDKRRRGGLIIHFGIVLMAIGICGNFFNQETSFTFSPGDQKTVGDYTLTFNKVRFFTKNNSKNRGIELDVQDGGEYVGKLLPVKSYYPTSPQPMTEVAIRRSFIEDLYISLSSINEDGSATIIVFINPMVNFVWASMVFFFVGILLSLSYKPIQLRKLS